MLRLVFGMGTRAVDREADDYARLLNMDNPTAPPMVAYGDEYKYSQHKMDVIGLKDNELETIKGISRQIRRCSWNWITPPPQDCAKWV